MSLLKELGLEQMPDWIIGPWYSSTLTNIPFAFIRDAITKGSLITFEPLPEFKRIQFVDLAAWFDALSAPRPQETRNEHYRQWAVGYLNWHNSRDYAHELTYRAYKSGILVRQPCEICGELKSEAHHDDYKLPLTVRYLCKKHHMQFHGEQRRRQKALKP